MEAKTVPAFSSADLSTLNRKRCLAWWQQSAYLPIPQHEYLSLMHEERAFGEVMLLR